MRTASSAWAWQGQSRGNWQKSCCIPAGCDCLASLCICCLDTKSLWCTGLTSASAFPEQRGPHAPLAPRLKALPDAHRWAMNYMSAPLGSSSLELPLTGGGGSLSSRMALSMISRYDSKVMYLSTSNQTVKGPQPSSQPPGSSRIFQSR